MYAYVWHSIHRVIWQFSNRHLHLFGIKGIQGSHGLFVYNASLSVKSNVFLKTRTNFNFNKIEETMVENLSLIYQGPFINYIIQRGEAGGLSWHYASAYGLVHKSIMERREGVQNYRRLNSQ